MDNYLNKTFVQSDIENYISSGAEESINLEFKSAEAFKFDKNGNLDENTKKELAKDVSAFANSDGGILIYGINENEHRAESISFINGKLISKESIEQIITSRIHRKIEGLFIDVVRIGRKIEQTIYVIRIPRSINAPHMTSDKRFYKRYNFQSVQMDEYEVRSLYNRQERTKLELLLPKIQTDFQGQNAGRPSNLKVNIQFNIRNNSQAIEELYKLEVRLPKVMAMNCAQGQDFFRNYVRHEDSHIVYVFPNRSPIFQTEFCTITIVDLYVNKNTISDVQQNALKITLYYSNGIEEMSFYLADHLIVGGKTITEKDMVY